MDHITPFTHAVFLGLESQRKLATDKQRQIRRHEEEKYLAHEDVYEHQVESLEEDHPDGEGNHQKRPPAKDENQDTQPGKPHIDLTA